MVAPLAPAMPPRRIKPFEIIICCFSSFECELDQFILVSTEQKMLVAIVIVIEKIIRVNQGLIEN
jgi:hypothetical protein